MNDLMQKTIKFHDTANFAVNGKFGAKKVIRYRISSNRIRFFNILRTCYFIHIVYEVLIAKIVIPLERVKN